MSFTHAETPAEAHAAFVLLHDTLLSWTGHEQPELDTAVDSLWGAMHGIITLTMTGRIAGGEQRAKSIAEQTVVNLLRAWRTAL